jgi:hypothetical protein
LLKNLVDRYPLIQSWRAQLARLYCFMGRLEDARREFTELARNEFDDLAIDGSFVSILSQLCTVSWFLKDRPRAGKLYTRLEPSGERIIVAGNTAICRAEPFRCPPLVRRRGRSRWRAQAVPLHG